MPEQPGAGRLEPETLAAYIDGLLPPEARARVEAQIAADPETYEWVVNAMTAVEDLGIVAPAEPAQVPPVAAPADEPTPAPEPRPGGGSGEEGKVLPFFRRRSVQSVMGTLMAAAAALIVVVRTQPVWWQEVWGPAVDPRFAKLVEAVGEERYIEARLTGGFKYGPLRQVMRGPGDLSTANVSLLELASELGRASQNQPSPSALHAWGVAQLLLGGPAVDAAVVTLEAAASSGPDARVYSDLSAAYLESARRNRDASRLRAALRAAETALRLEPTATEAAFNQALILEELGEWERAEGAWQALSWQELGDGWSAEVARRLDLVRSRRGATPRVGGPS